MQKKTLKFRDYLVTLVLSGEKNTTWRLFDDKNLSEGDRVDLINWNTKEKFGEAILKMVLEKEMGRLEDTDYEGHEKFKSNEEMYQTYRVYYGSKVGPETIVKIIRFQLL